MSLVKPSLPLFQRGKAQADGLVMCYPLTEGSDLPNDISGNSIPFTSKTSGITWTGSPFGHSLNFDGASSTQKLVIAAADAGDLNYVSGSGNLGIFFRIRVNSFSNSPVIMANGVFNSDGWYWQLSSTGEPIVALCRSGGTSQLGAPSNKWTAGVWYSIFLQLLPSGAVPRRELYKYNHETGATDLVGGNGAFYPDSSSRNFDIGNYPTNSFDAEMDLAEFRVYKDRYFDAQYVRRMFAGFA